jgi:cbb3-type cytochrome oxidase subunit 3
MFLEVPISRGQIIFAIIFLICFIIGMVWAYRSDRKVNRLYYKGVWVVLVAMIAFIALYNLAVKYINK